MAFIKKKGAEAAQSALTEKVDTSKLLRSLSKGKVVRARIVDIDAFSEYDANSVFGAFNTTPSGKSQGFPNLYDRAADILFAEAKAAKDAGNDELSSEIWKQANQIEAKLRYMYGFISLDDGQPGVIDLTENQGRSLAQDLAKSAKKIDKFAFEISKSGSGTNTAVKLTLLDLDDDLTPDERKHFEASAGVTFDVDLFEKVLSEVDEQTQIKGLYAFGFDVAKLGLGGATNSQPTDESAPIVDGSVDPTDNF